MLTQALTLLNNEFVHIQARHLAERVRREASDEAAQQIQMLYRITLSRTPTSQELAQCLSFLQKQQVYHHTRVVDATLTALTDLGHVLLNANEFVYIN